MILDQRIDDLNVLRELWKHRHALAAGPVEHDNLVVSYQGASKMTPRGADNDVLAKSVLADIVKANTFTWFNGLLGTLWVLMMLVAPPKQALFGLVIIFNTGIGIFQEYRASRELAKLMEVEVRCYGKETRERRIEAEGETAARRLVRLEKGRLADSERGLGFRS